MKIEKLPPPNNGGDSNFSFLADYVAGIACDNEFFVGGDNENLDLGVGGGNHDILAATLEIEVSFFSSGYLDVSVPPVPFHTLWIGVWILEVCSSGFPHSDISGSMDICSSPKLFAAYHVLHRLSVPRHPPCALNA